MITYYAFSQPRESGSQAPATAISESESTTSFSFPVHEQPKSLPVLAFVDGNRRKTTLASFRGKLILLNIWATWCTPCREEMPTLERLQAKLGSAEFEVVALSIDRAVVEKIENFYKELKLDALVVYVDPTGTAGSPLNVMGIPATLLINPQGDEIGRVLGPAEWDAPEMVEFIGRYLPTE
jgi:thiol-disulfide isomerase/thioredoxin